MTDLLSEPASPAQQRREATRDAVALLAFLGLFAVLDLAGLIYVLVRRPGEQMTVLITIGGVAILVMLVVLIGYLVTNPILPRPRSSGRPAVSCRRSPPTTGGRQGC